MSKVKFKVIRVDLNRSGVRSLLQGDAMQGIVGAHAKDKAKEAGAGYDSEVHMGQNRCYANIFPDSKEAAADNYENNTLEKVIRT